MKLQKKYKSGGSCREGQGGCEPRSEVIVKMQIESVGQGGFEELKLHYL